MDTTAAPDAMAQMSALIFATVLIDENGLIAHVNPAAEGLLERSAHKLVGKDIRDVMQIADQRVRESLSMQDMPMIARGIDIHVRSGDLTANITSSPIPTHPGWRILTISDAKQDTDPNEEQTELRAPAVLAHEIKNPLSAIRGASQLLERRVSKKDKSLTDMIRTETDRIAELIDRMQQLGSKDSADTEPCNLHEAIRNAMATVRAARPEGAELVEEFDPSLPSVVANKAGLEQVLINLLTNASDACCKVDDAAISVRTRYISGMRFSAWAFGKATQLPIEIKVSDPGPGIPSDLRDHIFEPFVTGKSHGQGLGLALVRKLVRDMGGRIAHDRDAKRGLTNFRINLAVAE